MPLSTLAKKRQVFQPELPAIFKTRKINSLVFFTVQSKEKGDSKVRPFFEHTFGQPLVSFSFKKTAASLKQPLKVGVVFSGGQAPGGHNVIAGLFDSLQKIHSKSELFGFLDGPSGIVECKYKKITAKELYEYRNQGGFDLLGSGRTKIETAEQLKASLKTALKLDLDGIVVIGGDDSNTNAAVMAEYFLKANAKTKVIGVPKTIDGDLRGKYIEASFGFDTATKVYSEMIGNIAKDALSAKKYYHFIKLMGRSASHVTLECALNTQVNFVFIAEEVLAKQMTLSKLIKELTVQIYQRMQKGKHYGVVLIPEGLIEFIPEVKTLIKELNILLAVGSKTAKDLEKIIGYKEKAKKITTLLSAKSLSCFNLLPDLIQEQLLFDRDPHGNVQVSKIETEKLLMELTAQELSKMAKEGEKLKFNVQPHFFGYEGRAGLPTTFDCNYCYSLGFTASILIKEGRTGYMASLTGLTKKPSDWKPLGVPLTSMIRLEMRKGKEKPVIQKALVDLKGQDFLKLQKMRKSLAEKDLYLCPGPFQF